MKKIVIASACRTAIGKFGGTLANVPAVELGSIVIKEALNRANVAPEQVDHVYMGCVIQAGLGQNVARQAALKAGLPIETPAVTVNVVCGSGLNCVNMAAQMIEAGDADIVVAGGMENMSMAPYALKNARYGYRMGNAPMIDTMVNDASRYNAQNTFEELLNLGTIPIVNENDTVSTSEIPYVDSFGDNDRLSAIVAALIGADLLILLSDIDGLYTDDPRTNKEARFISFVPEITKELLSMGKGTSGSDVGTGGMSAKLAAARIATDSGADMVIANGDHVEAVMEIVGGKETGTLFLAHTNLDFDLMHYLNNEY